MAYIKRLLELEKTLQSRSVLLFGPRQTGKSTFLRNQLPRPPDLVFNLLDQRTFLNLKTDPTVMSQQILALDLRERLVIVDEIQLMPELLNEVHLLIEEHGVKFVLTGSSARKLKRQGVNLLGGRGRDRSFHPFVYLEVEHHSFRLESAFQTGLIPNHFLSDAPSEDLLAYTGRYLTEEIMAESLVRNVGAFSRFLEIAAGCNGQLINLSSIASDAGVPRTTVQGYFQILKDTLIAKELPAFSKGQKRRAIETAKFYFFDMGVVHSLRRLGPIVAGSKDFGDFFEHFIYCELTAYISYKSQTSRLSFWRTAAGHEVDFIFDEKLAIEVKSTTHVQAKHLSGLLALKEEKLAIAQYILVCQEEVPRQHPEGILILPWKVFLQRLWAGELGN